MASSADNYWKCNSVLGKLMFSYNFYPSRGGISSLVLVVNQRAIQITLGYIDRCSSLAEDSYNMFKLYASSKQQTCKPFHFHFSINKSSCTSRALLYSTTKEDKTLLFYFWQQQIFLHYRSMFLPWPVKIVMCDQSKNQNTSYS